jgi:hypothetical protein
LLQLALDVSDQAFTLTVNFKSPTSVVQDELSGPALAFMDELSHGLQPLAYIPAL